MARLRPAPVVRGCARPTPAAPLLWPPPPGPAGSPAGSPGRPPAPPSRNGGARRAPTRPPPLRRRRRRRRQRSQDDARDTFKTLRSQNIGDTCAALYTEWAALEAGAGHVSKALGVLHKGIREGARPAEWAARRRRVAACEQRVHARPAAGLLLALAQRCARAASTAACRLPPAEPVPAPAPCTPPARRAMERLLAEIQSGPLDLRNANFTDTITMRGLGRQQLVGGGCGGWGIAAAARSPSGPRSTLGADGAAAPPRGGNPCAGRASHRRAPPALPPQAAKDISIHDLVAAPADREAAGAGGPAAPQRAPGPRPRLAGRRPPPSARVARRASAARACCARSPPAGAAPAPRADRPVHGRVAAVQELHTNHSIASTSTRSTSSTGAPAPGRPAAPLALAPAAPAPGPPAPLQCLAPALPPPPPALKPPTPHPSCAPPPQHTRAPTPRAACPPPAAAQTR